MKKRVLAMLLAFVMVVTMLPVSVLAEGGSPATTGHTDAGHSCQHCGGAAAVWTAWDGTKAGFAPVADGQVAHYVLTADAAQVTLDATVNLTAGTYVLCLNGKTLNGATAGRHFRLSGTAALVIEDCTATGDPREEGYTAGTLTGATNSAVYTGENASLTVYDGIFSGNTATNANGGAIRSEGKTLNILGGLFRNNTSTANSSSVGLGGAIYIGASTALLRDTMVTANTAATAGAVAFQVGAQVTIQDSVITGNTCQKNNFPGGVYMTGNTSALTVTGKVVIAGNTGVGDNAAIYKDMRLQQAANKLKVSALAEGSQIAFGAVGTLEGGVIVPENQTQWNCGMLTLGGKPIDYYDSNKDNTLDAFREGHYHGDQLYTALTAANEGSLGAGGYYYLAGDYTLSGAKSMVSGRTLHLCLNSHTLSGNGTQRLFTLPPAATATCTLVVEDCWAYTDAENVYHAGKLTGGNDTGNSGGGAIYIGKKGVVELKDGIITGNRATKGGGAICMQDGGAVLRVLNGEISNNTTAAAGGAIYQGGSGSRIEMTGGTVSGNTATGNGGALFVKGAVEISNVLFAGNTSKAEGGVIRAEGATVTLTDTTITKNSSKYTSAISLTSAAQVTVNGGSITENKATNGYGAIYPPNGANVLTLKGNVQIKDNLWGTKKHNILLKSSTNQPMINVEGLTDTAVIGVTVDAARIAANGVHIGNSKPGESCAAAFVSDVEPYTFGQKDTKIYLKNGHDHCACGSKTCTEHPAMELLPWVDADGAAITNRLPTAGNWYLTEDVTVTGHTSLENTELTLCLNGHNITVVTTGTAGSRVFNVKGGVTLNIADCGATPGKLTGGKASAILFASGSANSVVNMYGGEITGNTSQEAGAGVIVQGKNTFNMYGGKITGNTAQTVLKANGTPVSKISSGGGIAVIGANATFNMYGGEISDNEAKAVTYTEGGKETTVGGNGGGIYATGNVNLLGGKITGNKAEVSGGALHLTTKETQIKDIEISGNTAGNSGGAVFIAGGKHTVTNATITGNTAAYTGALYLSAAADVTVDSSTITGNQTTKSLGAVYVPNANTKLTLKGNVQIKDNLRGTEKHNVFFRNIVDSQPMIHVEGLADTAVICATVDNARVEANVLEVATCPENENCAAKFVNDNPLYSFGQDGTTIYVKDGHDHAVCNQQGCKDHAVVEMLPWENASKLPTSGNWFLTTDVTLKTHTSLENAELTLCLNGHTIKVETTGTAGSRVFNVRGGVTLNITDCAATPGKLTGGKSSAIIFTSAAENSVLNLYGGEITGNTSTEGGAGVSLQGKNTFNMYGGKITGNTAQAVVKVGADGKPVLDEKGNQQVSSKVSSGGGVAVIGSKATFNMYGGEISGNTAKAVTCVTAEGKEITYGGNGGAIYSTGNQNLLGGKITGNTADFDGGALHATASTTQIKNVEISGNTAGEEGGAMFIAGGKLDVVNATITGNTAAYTSAMYLSAGVEATVESSTVTGNQATKGFGAIYVPNNKTKLTLKGNVQIKDNLKGTEKHNVFFRNVVDSQPMIHVENLADTAVIGANVADARLQANVLEVATCPENEQCAAKFVNDNPAFSFAQNGTVIYVTDGHNHAVCNEKDCKDHAILEMLPWQDATKLPTSGNWFLTTDVTLKVHTSLENATLNLCLNGHTVKVETKGVTASRVFNVRGGVTLNITDCAATPGKLTGGKASAILFASGSANSVVNLYNGIITGNSSQEGGAGIAVQGKNTFNMYGGKITGNNVQAVVKVDANNKPILDEKGNQQVTSVVSGGGAVTVVGEEAVFNLYAGEITDNQVKAVTYVADGKKTTAGGSGGAVYATAGGKVNIYGGKITGNKAEKNGGALYMSSRSVLTMKDGEISGNTAQYGGGIFVYSGEAYLLGGAICKNKAAKEGGGLTGTQSTAKVVLDGASVTSNTATSAAGGIGMMLSSNFEFKSGKINSNTVTEGMGGGLVLSSGANGVLTGGSISYNTAKLDGGAFCLYGAKAKMSGVSVIGNKTPANGGAIKLGRARMNVNGVSQMVPSTMTMSSCYVANNDGNHGGSVLVEGEGSALTIYGGTFKDNKSNGDGGAIYASNNTKINIYDSKFTGNSARVRGGALRIAYYATAVVEDSVFTENTSGGMGGAICAWHAASSTFDNITVTDNVAGGLGGGICFRGNPKSQSLMDTVGAIRNSTISNNKGETGGAIALNNWIDVEIDNCVMENNEATQHGGGVFGTNTTEMRINNCVINNNRAALVGGGVGGMCAVYVTNSKITNNVAGTNGGGFGGFIMGTSPLFLRPTGVFMTNVTISGNKAAENGGGMYMPRGCDAYITDMVIENNTCSEIGSGLYVGYDLSAKNLTVTGNTSTGDGYALYIMPAEFDGLSYTTGHKELGGLVKVTGNTGGNLFLAEESVFSIPGAGLAEGSKIEITLADGVITNRVFGVYDYEGGNLVYTLTPGTRSITDPEEPVAEPETPADDETQPGAATGESIVLYVGVIAFAVVIVAVAVILVLLNKKKKKAVETADTTQE